MAFLDSLWETLKEVWEQWFGDGGSFKEIDDDLEELHDDELEDWERDWEDSGQSDEDRSNTSSSWPGNDFDTSHW